MRWIVIVVAIIVVVATIGYFVLGRKHPENAAGHSDSGSDTSTQLFGGVDDRPAGPGAESQGVADGGQIMPGPSADSLPVDTPLDRS